MLPTVAGSPSYFYRPVTVLPATRNCYFFNYYIRFSFWRNDIRFKYYQCKKRALGGIPQNMGANFFNTLKENTAGK